MITATIPTWNALGVLPPINQAQPNGPDRSPYSVTLSDVVQRFATTAQRRQILLGLLDYRAALHNLGLLDGFQWLDGSFMENIELVERRAPRDLDVVTFAATASSIALTNDDLLLFDQAHTKNRFKLDAYWVELDQLTPRELTSWASYWYSMWAHRRNQVWKGFLQIELAPDEDSGARALLLQAEPTGEIGND